MAYSGKFKPKQPDKYIGDINNIVFRSTYELKLMKWLDRSNTVIKWASEEVIVPYINPFDNKVHRYFTDFYVEIKNQDEDIKRYLVEVKPRIQTRMPVKRKRKTKKYIQEMKTYIINQSKWNAATKFAEKRGWEFVTLTEKELRINK